MLKPTKITKVRQSNALKLEVQIFMQITLVPATDTVTEKEFFQDIIVFS